MIYVIDGIDSSEDFLTINFFVFVKYGYDEDDGGALIASLAHLPGCR